MPSLTLPRRHERRQPSRAPRCRTFAAAALFLLAGISGAAAHGASAGPIALDHPWSRATPPGAPTAAGFVAIRNDGPTDRLVSATAEIAGRAEIHEMAVRDGVMTMRRLPDGLEIPAGGEARLEPGSVHLMFFDLKQPLEQGVPFQGTLTFEQAGTVAVEFAVEAAGARRPAPDGQDDQDRHAAHGTPP